MSEKNMELMKKIIEEKKKKSAEQGELSRINLNLGDSKKPFKKSKKR